MTLRQYLFEQKQEHPEFMRQIHKEVTDIEISRCKMQQNYTDLDQLIRIAGLNDEPVFKYAADFVLLTYIMDHNKSYVLGKMFAHYTAIKDRADYDAHLELHEHLEKLDNLKESQLSYRL